ncbi:hypothetical protein D3C81_1451600 [compost metagenome]
MLLLVPQVDIQFVDIVARQRQPTRFMVCGHDYGGIAVFFGELDRGLKGGVEIKCLLNKRRKIVGMSGMVDPAAFNHHDKTILILGQNLQSGRSHCRKARNFGGTVRSVSNMGTAKEAKHLGCRSRESL